MKILKPLLSAFLFFTFSSLVAQDNWDFGLRLAHSVGTKIATNTTFQGGQSMAVFTEHLGRISGTSIGVVGRRKNLFKEMDLDFEAGYLQDWQILRNSTIESYKANFLYLNAVPKFRLGEKWYLAAGLEGRYSLNNPFNFENKWNVSGVLGLEYRLNERVNFYVSYKKSFVPTTRHITGDFTRIGHTNRGLELGVTFFLKKNR